MTRLSPSLKDEDTDMVEGTSDLGDEDTDMAEGTSDLGDHRDSSLPSFRMPQVGPTLFYP